MFLIFLAPVVLKSQPEGLRCENGCQDKHFVVLQARAHLNAYDPLCSPSSHLAGNLNLLSKAIESNRIESKYRQ